MVKIGRGSEESQGPDLAAFVLAPQIAGSLAATKYFFSFTGVGGPDTIQDAGRFDYLDYPVSCEARALAPTSFGGWSGGGIWQVPIKKTGTELSHLRPLLAGIMFYQVATTETECGVRGHGPKSIYGAAHDAMVGTGAYAGR